MRQPVAAIHKKCGAMERYKIKSLKMGCEALGGE